MESGMIELTVQQHQTLETNGAAATRAVDPVTKAEYVLVPAVGGCEQPVLIISPDRRWANDRR